VDFHVSIQLGNNSWNVHYNLGLCYTQLHQLQPAIQELRQAVLLEPTSLPAKYALGIALPQARLSQLSKSLRARKALASATANWEFSGLACRAF
jgi:tetratricopeptide (TPR) repeat protein